MPPRRELWFKKDVQNAGMMRDKLATILHIVKLRMRLMVEVDMRRRR